MATTRARPPGFPAQLLCRVASFLSVPAHAPSACSRGAHRARGVHGFSWTTATAAAVLLLATGLTSCPAALARGAAARAPVIYRHKVVKTYPHDPKAFTQGLLYYGKDGRGEDILFESTGLYGRSTVRRVELRTGAVLASRRNAASVFAEGLALVRNRTRLAQIQWKAQSGFLYSPGALSSRGTFTHGMTDGWGLASSPGGRLYGSDGTVFLYELDPRSFKVIKKVTVKDGNATIFNLNELEFVNGFILANVWMTPCIARINPSTGQVVGWVVLDQLVDAVSGGRAVDVLNGIAWDRASGRLFVTGKLWPSLFEIKLVPQKPSNYGQAIKGVRALCWPTSQF